MPTPWGLGVGIQLFFYEYKIVCALAEYETDHLHEASNPESRVWGGNCIPGHI
jgi:hypothetical protein